MSQGSQSQSLDDVPIAISDKWKPPPLPHITEDMVERFFLPRLGPHYDYTLEQKVLDKISEWEVRRQQQVEARDERLKLRHEERQQRLEAEGTQLKEKLTQLSYPSPEEFSSSSEEGHVRLPTFELLTPTVVSDSNAKPCMWNGNMANLEISDFERASDPWTHVELKTMNDLDLLAQVLNSSHVHSSESPPEKEVQVTEKPTEIASEPEPPTQMNGCGGGNFTQNNFYMPNPMLMTSYAFTNYAPYTADEESPLKSSRSVPDIVKELENEVNDSQKRRIRNNSQCTESRNVSGQQRITSNTKSSSRSRNCDVETLTKLPKEVQQLIQNISQMGFPVDRVFRVAEQFQGDDKKMIEHLIPLSELLDLGFEEKRISEALIKFDNNKEKALDFLIS